MASPRYPPRLLPPSLNSPMANLKCPPHSLALLPSPPPTVPSPPRLHLSRLPAPAPSPSTARSSSLRSAWPQPPSYRRARLEECSEITHLLLCCHNSCISNMGLLDDYDSNDWRLGEGVFKSIIIGYGGLDASGSSWRAVASVI